ncbi:MAG: DUF3737 family protein [Corallococcus sp.]|nr:DUF3737 family protein [Corallococcus sp.]
MNLKKIEGQKFSDERALYGIRNTFVINCNFAGEADGESALKECNNIAVQGCFFDLRYPLWHANGLKLDDCQLSPHCRAALWYANDVDVRNCKMRGIKAFRECKNIRIVNSEVDSPEFGWRCNGVISYGSSVKSEYAFFESKNIKIDNMELAGKYSFQYTENLTVSNSVLDTKDAFWHSKNVTVTDSYLTGEYLGWYSDNVTLVRCHIKGTQPLCYCKRLTLVDCTMENTDLCFENSDVNASVIGSIDSVKNIRSGKVVADAVGETIVTNDSPYPVGGKVVIR